MNMKNKQMNGLVAGGIIAILSVAFIIVSWGAIEQHALEAGFSGDGGIVDWVIRWAAIALVIGLVASVAFSFVSARLNWTKSQYLSLSLLLMAALDVLAYLPIYDSSVHVYPAAYLGLNAIFCIGLGILIPTLNKMSYHGRPAL